jgi:hypothetical protein
MLKFLPLIFLFCSNALAWDLSTCENVHWTSPREQSTWQQECQTYCSYYGANWCACTDSCTLTGNTVPPCVVNTCTAPAPLCEQTTQGTDNCGGICTLTGPACPPPCVPDGSCSAPIPACGVTTYGQDNCGIQCSKTGEACRYVYDTKSKRCRDTITGRFVKTSLCK